MYRLKLNTGRDVAPSPAISKNIIYSFQTSMIFFPVYPALPQTCRDGAASVNRENSGYIATGLLEEDLAGLLCRWSIQVPLTSTIVDLYKN